MNRSIPVGGVGRIAPLLALLTVTWTATGSAAILTSDPALLPTPTQAHTIRTLTATALARVAEARDAFHHGDQAKALASLSEVRVELNLVAAARPNGEAKALLHYVQAHMGFENNQRVLPDLLPLEHALRAMRQSPAVDAAENEMDIVKTSLEAPDREDALDALDEINTDLSDASIDTPLATADRDVDTAIQTVTRTHTAPDQKTLQNLEKNLRTLLDSPALEDVTDG